MVAIRILNLPHHLTRLTIFREIACIPLADSTLENTSAEGGNMKSRIRVSCGAAVLLILPAFAQGAQQQDTAAKVSRKVVNISGSIGSDAKTLVSDRDQRAWIVANPDALKNSAGRHVTIHGYVNSSTSEIVVISVKTVTEETTVAKLDDAAFRR